MLVHSPINEKIDRSVEDDLNLPSEDRIPFSIERRDYSILV